MKKRKLYFIAFAVLVGLFGAGCRQIDEATKEAIRICEKAGGTVVISNIKAFSDGDIRCIFNSSKECPPCSECSVNNEIKTPLPTTENSATSTITSKDFEEYKKWFNFYKDAFGYSDWKITFINEDKKFPITYTDSYGNEEQKDKPVCGWISTFLWSKSATTGIAKNLDNCDIKTTAKHEAIHLLLNNFKVEGIDEERIVMKLEDLIN